MYYEQEPIVYEDVTAHGWKTEAWIQTLMETMSVPGTVKVV